MRALNKMILVIDNFDSFTYNLVQILGEIVKKEKKILIFRNNQLTLQQIEKMNPNSIVISPGPCTPNEAGISTSIFQHFHKKKPILRNNQLTLQQIEKMNPNSIVISPGPCTPNEAGISTSIFQHFHKKKPIL